MQLLKLNWIWWIPGLNLGIRRASLNWPREICNFWFNSCLWIRRPFGIHVFSPECAFHMKGADSTLDRPRFKRFLEDCGRFYSQMEPTKRGTWASRCPWGSAKGRRMEWIRIVWIMKRKEMGSECDGAALSKLIDILLNSLNDLHVQNHWVDGTTAESPEFRSSYSGEFGHRVAELFSVVGNSELNPVRVVRSALNWVAIEGAELDCINT